MSNKITAVLKKWSDYDTSVRLHLRPMLHVRDYERIVTNERDRLEAERIIDRLGIVLCD